MTNATMNGKAGKATSTTPATTAQPPKAPAPTPPAKAVDLATPVFDYSRFRDLEGVEYVRSWECARLLDIVNAAMREAESSARRAERAPTEVEVREALSAALTCLSTAEHYALMLLEQLPVEYAHGDDKPSVLGPVAHEPMPGEVPMF